MLPFSRSANAALLLIIPGLFTVTATAQTVDNSANSTLKGDFFVRQVLLSGISSSGTIGRARSVIGVATFDGNGNYSFTGQMADTQSAGQSKSYTASGQYSVGSNGLFQIQNLIDSQDTDYGGVGGPGPSAFVASAVEGPYFDVLVGIPAGSGISNSSLNGAFRAGYIDYLQGDITKVRDAYFTLNANGQGSFGNVSVNGSAANMGSTNLTQTASNVSYSLTGNGSGTANFGSASASQLISGNKTLYVSSDGNLVLGGDPAGFDLLVGMKAMTAASNANYLGTYYVAALEDDASQLSSGTSFIDSFYGTTNANGQGTSISHYRFDPASDTVYDYTFDSTTKLDPTGMYTSTDGFFQYILGANGQAVLVVGRQDEYTLTVGFQAKSYAGTSVFLYPTGIVNAASFAPITNSVAPSEYVTLFGSGLSSATLFAPSFPLMTNLGGVQATVNGRQAPLLFVSPSQVTLLVPSATTENYATFQVSNGGVNSNPVTVFVNATSPGVWTALSNGVSDARVQHAADFSLVSASNPAKPGETIVVYCTGLGSVTNPPADGAAAPSNPLSTVNSDIAVYIDGVQATVSFKGLTPGFPSLYQLNVVVPNNITRGGPVYLDVSTPDAYTSEAKIAIAP